MVEYFKIGGDYIVFLALIVSQIGALGVTVVQQEAELSEGQISLRTDAAVTVMSLIGLPFILLTYGLLIYTAFYFGILKAFLIFIIGSFAAATIQGMLRKSFYSLDRLIISLVMLITGVATLIWRIFI